jgi:hypothetical protein
MFCAITSPVEDATTDLGDMLVPPTVFTNLSRAGFAETREADAELVPKDGTRAAINTNTHAVRFIFGSMERNMERWYQRGFINPVLRYFATWDPPNCNPKPQFRGTITQLLDMRMTCP